MAKLKTYKIILDTNWYVSAFINKKSRRTLYEILKDKRFIILFSKELIQEYRNVIIRPKFEKYIKPHQAQRFENLLISRLTEVKITSNIRQSRDVKDNYLLSMSIDSKADFLITGDDDLLVLKQIGKTKILTKADFFEFISTLA
jgi:uncharacterized protein